MSAKRLVTVIVPCRNEARDIRPFLDSLAAQQLPPDVAVEVFIADGMSEDGTRAVLEKYRARHPEVEVFDNPGRIVPTGLNEAIRRARGEIVVRMDVHSEYAPDYIAQCLAVLEETGADNVGGPARTMAEGYVQQAIALAYHSGFASGGARFHNPAYEGYVDTVTFGCWRKRTLEELGLFDQALVRNQDDELNLRLVRRGGRIWQSPRIRCWFKPRRSLRALFRQYYQYGFWKVYVIRKHRLPASVRHLVPAVFMAGLLGLPWVALVSAPGRALLALWAGSYLLANAGASLLACRSKPRFLPIMPVVFAAYHFSYGLGFLRGLFRRVPELGAALRPRAQFTPAGRNPG